MRAHLIQPFLLQHCHLLGQIGTEGRYKFVARSSSDLALHARKGRPLVHCVAIFTVAGQAARLQIAIFNGRDRLGHLHDHEPRLSAPPSGERSKMTPFKPA